MYVIDYFSSLKTNFKLICLLKGKKKKKKKNFKIMKDNQDL